jgi:type I restriction enzyme S subunit
MVIAGYIIRVRLNTRATPTYLSAVLNSDYGKITLRTMCKTIIGQANINAQELQNIKILIPPVDLQNQFAAFVEQADKLKFAAYVNRHAKVIQILPDRRAKVIHLA